MLVYVLTNKINGKQYVGQTIRPLEKRLKGHLWLSSATQKNMPVAHAIQKYGWTNFIVKIVCKCKSQEELDNKEVYYVKALKTLSPHGYNLRAGGGGIGIMSDLTKKKISRSNIGKKASEDTRKRLSESHKGHIVSKETKEKLSRFYKGQKLPEKARINCITANSKTYLFINPEGIVVSITNLKKFCRNNKLNYTSMFNLTIGKRKRPYKGWKFCRDPKSERGVEI